MSTCSQALVVCMAIVGVGCIEELGSSSSALGGWEGTVGIDLVFEAGHESASGRFGVLSGVDPSVEGMRGESCSQCPLVRCQDHAGLRLDGVGAMGGWSDPTLRLESVFDPVSGPSALPSPAGVRLNSVFAPFALPPVIFRVERCRRVPSGPSSRDSSGTRLRRRDRRRRWGGVRGTPASRPLRTSGMSR